MNTLHRLLGVFTFAGLVHIVAQVAGDAPAQRVYDNFQQAPPGVLPPGYAGTSFPRAGAAPWTIMRTSDGNVLGEPSRGAAFDILYYHTKAPMASVSESFSFTYSGPSSVVEPYFLESGLDGAAAGNAGYRVDLRPAREDLKDPRMAGALIHQYVDGTGARFVALGSRRLATEPYHYVTGHTYRVDAMLDATTGVLTARVYDTSLGATQYDVGMRSLIPAETRVFPGVINRVGGSVGLRDFAFGPAGKLPPIPEIPGRAGDYLDYLGINAGHSASAQSVATDVESQGDVRYLSELHIKHVRISVDQNAGSPAPTANLLAPDGVQFDCLTSDSTTVERLRKFITTLRNGCSELELENEPNLNLRDLNWELSNPAAAVAYKAAFPQLFLWGPSITPQHFGPPQAEQMMAARTVASGARADVRIADVIDAWNAHPYTAYYQPEILIGGAFFRGCGASFSEDCGYYNSLGFYRNESATLAPNLPGGSTEGVGSYASSTYCPGAVDFATQQAYAQRGLMLGFKSGLARAYLYKLVDDGGCNDAAWGLLNRLQNLDGTTYAITPKPAFTALAALNRLLLDAGDAARTFHQVPLALGLDDAPPDVEKLLLEESDGSYRLVLWSDLPLWNPDTKQEDPPVSEGVVLRLGSSAASTVYEQTAGAGTWHAQAMVTGNRLPIKVSQYPLVVDIIPARLRVTPAPVPSGISTPGPITETAAPVVPTPIPTSTSALYSNTFNSETLGQLPRAWLVSTNSAPWAVSKLDPRSASEAFGEGAGATVGDRAWYNAYGSREGSVECQFAFKAASPFEAPVDVFFTRPELRSSRSVRISTGKIGYFTKNAFDASHGPVPGYLAPLIIGERYGVKVLLSKGNTWKMKVWDLSNAEPAYGAEFTDTSTHFTPTACGVRSISKVAWWIDDFSAAFNGAALPALR